MTNQQKQHFVKTYLNTYSKLECDQHVITRRSIDCPDDEQGKLGFNTYNFLTFIILTVNAVINSQ